MSNAGGGFGEVTFGNQSASDTTTTTTTTNEAYNPVATAQTANAPLLSAGGTGNTISYQGSDFGAIAAATAIYGQAQNLLAAGAADSQTTARLALMEGANAVQGQGSAALSQITKPFLYGLGILIVGAGIIVWFIFGRKK